MKYLFLLLLLCLPSVASAQIEIKDSYGQYEPIEFTLRPQENAQAVWEVRPLSGQTEYTTRQYGQTQAMWAQPGKYLIVATVVVVDFDAKTFKIDKYSKEIAVGSLPPSPVPPPPTPPTPPGPVPPSPTPSVPTDKFNNLGQRVDAACTAANLQLDKRQTVGAIYQDVANSMKSGKIVTVGAAASTQLAKEKALALDTSWAPVRKIVVDEGVARTPMSWEDVILLYEATARGYNGR